MRVVHLVTTESGGAARAAERIAAAERKVGIDAVMLYAEGGSEKECITWHWKEKLQLKFFNRFNHAVQKKALSGKNAVRSISPDLYGFDITHLPVIQQTDVIHLHWVSDGMISPGSLKKLAEMGKKVVWTLHDQRPYTGGCHYAEECKRYKKMCGSCPALHNGDAGEILRSPENEDRSQIKSDFSTKCQAVMRKAVEKLDVTVVGCSKWMTECAAESSTFKGKKCINIPNPIDTDIFDVQDRSTVRKLLGLPLDKKLILFGAENADSDRRKGYQELLSALRKLPADEYSCVVFGNSKELKTELDIEVISLGFIRDDFHLKCVYNACDVFVSPSLFENLANTVMESLSCGTPVTAFGIGGMADMINHEENGYLAEAGNSDDLAAGIMYCADHDLREKARNTVLGKFTYNIIGTRYKKLYEED